jgi:F420-dependent methylenetetrahydromethanopterin dehydrogenase
MRVKMDPEELEALAEDIDPKNNYDLVLYKTHNPESAVSLTNQQRIVIVAALKMYTKINMDYNLSKQ